MGSQDAGERSPLLQNTLAEEELAVSVLKECPSPYSAANLLDELHADATIVDAPTAPTAPTAAAAPTGGTNTGATQQRTPTKRTPKKRSREEQGRGTQQQKKKKKAAVVAFATATPVTTTTAASVTTATPLVSFPSGALASSPSGGGIVRKNFTKVEWKKMLAQGLSRRQCDLVDKLLREQFIKAETGQGHHELKGLYSPFNEIQYGVHYRDQGKDTTAGHRILRVRSRVACGLTGMPLLHWYAMKCESDGEIEAWQIKTSAPIDSMKRNAKVKHLDVSFFAPPTTTTTTATTSTII